MSLTGIQLKKDEFMEYEGKKMCCFHLHYPNNSKTFMCESKDEYDNWVSKIKIVTGYHDLQEVLEIKQKLGEGYYGIVKLCIEKKSKREAAIKCISKKEMSSSDMQQVRNEIEILKICQHPNIVKLYDLFENEEFIFIGNT